jgi:hypothetical protein
MNQDGVRIHNNDSKMVDHGSLYSKVLYDVDGNPLIDPDTNKYLNVYTKAMQDAFDNKQIRLIHQVMKEPTYHYFVTSREQERDFKMYRHSHKKPLYHVYVDEDSRDNYDAK